MQKDIGSVMGLYPTPVTVVGIILEDRTTANFLTVAHVGIVEHGHLSISIDKGHTLSDAVIAQNGMVSVSLVNEKMMKAADYCGCVKGAEKSKSEVFKWNEDDLKLAPIIEEAPICMSCKVVDMFEVGNFHNYILKPVHTYVQEDCLTKEGKIDYMKVRPLLFEFQTAKYLDLGEIVGDSFSCGKDFDPAINRSERENCGIECLLHEGKRLELMCYSNMSGRSTHDYAKVFRFDEENTARLLACLGREIPKTGKEMEDIIDEFFGHYWYSNKFENYCDAKDLHYEWAVHVEYPSAYYDAGKC